MFCFRTHLHLVITIYDYLEREICFPSKDYTPTEDFKSVPHHVHNCFLSTLANSIYVDQSSSFPPVLDRP